MSGPHESQHVHVSSPAAAESPVLVLQELSLMDPVVQVLYPSDTHEPHTFLDHMRPLQLFCSLYKVPPRPLQYISRTGERDPLTLHVSCKTVS